MVKLRARLNSAEPDVAAPSAKTLAARLREQISDEIMRGALAPGAALEEAELARRFEVSRTPVREAIRLLVSTGLVEARPHRSAVVARATKAQLSAMFEALLELEALCAGFAAARMTKAERSDLRQINGQLLAAVRAGDHQRYHEQNERFHFSIYTGAHNPHLERLTLETRTRISPFSRAQFRTLGRLARSHAEHEVVLRAIVEGSREAAAAAMRAHITNVHEAYANYLGD